MGGDESKDAAAEKTTCSPHVPAGGAKGSGLTGKVPLIQSTHGSSASRAAAIRQVHLALATAARRHIGQSDDARRQHVQVAAEQDERGPTAAGTTNAVAWMASRATARRSMRRRAQFIRGVAPAWTGRTTPM